MKPLEVDDDGYPTDQTLAEIEVYGGDLLEFFAGLYKVWHLASWGWHEGRGKGLLGEWVRRFHISTAGWSGNESLVEAMRKNYFLWHYAWVQERVGGHFIFEVKKGARCPTKEELEAGRKSLIERGLISA